MRARAEVVKVNGEKAIVKIIGGDCVSCPLKETCLKKEVYLEVDNRDYKVGQLIELPLMERDEDILLTSVLLFGLPLGSVLLSIALAQKLISSSGWAISSGLIIGTLLATVTLKLLNHHFKGKHIKNGVNRDVSVKSDDT